MPWTEQEASKHIKGLSRHQRKVWAKVANKALEEYKDEGTAIRVANTEAKKARRWGQ